MKQDKWLRRRLSGQTTERTKKKAKRSQSIPVARQGNNIDYGSHFQSQWCFSIRNKIDTANETSWIGTVFLSLYWNFADFISVAQQAWLWAVAFLSTICLGKRDQAIFFMWFMCYKAIHAGPLYSIFFCLKNVDFRIEMIRFLFLIIEYAFQPIAIHRGCNGLVMQSKHIQLNTITLLTNCPKCQAYHRFFIITSLYQSKKMKYEWQQWHFDWIYQFNHLIWKKKKKISSLDLPLKIFRTS